MKIKESNFVEALSHRNERALEYVMCIGFGVVSASVLVWGTFRMNSKYGEWGLMKLHALRSHPRYIISRRKFLRLFSPTIKNRKA